jgi:hypothetical protein
MHPALPAKCCSVFACPGSGDHETGLDPYPVGAQVCAVLHFHEFRWCCAVLYEEVRRVSPPLCVVAEGQSDGLGDDRGVRVKEPCEGDELAFQCALTLRSPCREWLESNDMGASAKGNPPQIYPPTLITTQYGILAPTTTRTPNRLENRLKQHP